MKNTVGFVTVLASWVLAGCAAAPNAYQYGYAYSESATRVAVVESVRVVPMKKDANGSWKGAAAQLGGAVLGGAIGSKVGKGDGRQAATILGAGVGTVATTAAMQDASTVKGLEITYTLEGCRGDDCTRTIVQEWDQDGARFKPHDLVRISRGNAGARVNPL